MNSARQTAPDFYKIMNGYNLPFIFSDTANYGEFCIISYKDDPDNEELALMEQKGYLQRPEIDGGKPVYHNKRGAYNVKAVLCKPPEDKAD